MNEQEYNAAISKIATDCIQQVQDGGSTSVREEAIDLAQSDEWHLFGSLSECFAAIEGGYFTNTKDAHLWTDQDCIIDAIIVYCEECTRLDVVAKIEEILGSEECDKTPQQPIKQYDKK